MVSTRHEQPCTKINYMYRVPKCIAFRYTTQLVKSHLCDRSHHVPLANMPVVFVDGCEKWFRCLWWRCWQRGCERRRHQNLIRNEYIRLRDVEERVLPRRLTSSSKGSGLFEGHAPQRARHLAYDYSFDRLSLAPEQLRATQHALVCSTSSANPRTRGSISATRATFVKRGEFVVFHL